MMHVQPYCALGGTTKITNAHLHTMLTKFSMTVRIRILVSHMAKAHESCDLPIFPSSSNLSFFLHYSPPCSKTPIMLKWATPAYSQILMDNLDGYQKADSKQHIALVKDIKAQIQNSAENDHKAAPDDLTSVWNTSSGCWISNNICHPRKYVTGCATIARPWLQMIALLNLTMRHPS
jgi:hypothetical protein